jgi:hypothetical protein
MNAMRRLLWKAGYSTVAIALLIPLSGFTSCDQFHPTVIPAQGDSTRPTALAGVYDPATGQYRDLEDIGLGTGRQLSYTVHSAELSKTFVAVSAVTKEGGIKSLNMQAHIYVECYQDLPTGRVWHPHQFDGGSTSDSQAGSPGDTVSNGIYVGLPVPFDLYAKPDGTSPWCDAGDHLLEVSFVWTLWGEDFWSNANGDDSNPSITYVP